MWAFEAPGYSQPFYGSGKGRIYETLPPDTTMPAALGHTRFIVFVGAADTAALRQALAVRDAFLLIFESDAARLARFAQDVSPVQLAKRAIILHGDLQAFEPPLSSVLSKQAFQHGFPVFFALPEVVRSQRVYLEQVEALLETMFYRHCIYPLSGQSHNRGLPLRPMLRSLFFDQQLHSYENVLDYTTQPDISALRKAFLGETAILVAAGPDLAAKIEYLRQQRDNALVLAVNNALKPMLAAGVRPHFVVVNDTSGLTAKSWEGLPPLPDIPLVAHCLSNLGGAVFPAKFLFGNYRPELFGTRPGLRLHGSVITTAFSLARHMGCARCVLVGAQLASATGKVMEYAKNSIHEAGPPPHQAPSSDFGHPQLFPVTNALGVRLHTNLNFLDASLWLMDEIRTSGVPCVNTTMESLVHGPGVEYDPNYQVPPSAHLAQRRARLAARRQPTDRDRQGIREAMGADLGAWHSVVVGVREILELPPGQDFLTPAFALLTQFDQSNISYLVQRFEDFDNPHFHRQVFEGRDVAEREAGMRYYLEYVLRMAGVFVAEIQRCIQSLENGR
ncbi:MAG: DUF115 domain-containing protein [Humidesulfovibrio sp.]|nr:DUF115 domain-containing protein [Humidesulfovibrio sp.]